MYVTRYYNKFRDRINQLCTIEIRQLQEDNTNQYTSEFAQVFGDANEVLTTDSPFVVEYTTNNKLDVYKSSGATINLISETPFQFLNLHTDNKQKYMIVFKVDNKLKWLGWLDTETYSEDFNKYKNYEVEFTGADFNVLERIKYYQDDVNETKYKGVSSHLDIIKRCINKLNLPFNNIYICCSTTVNNVNEFVLDYCYQQNKNFYDEDNEPMNIKDVLHAVLLPYNLCITQINGDLWIYDTNAITQKSSIRKYDSEFNYVDTITNNINSVNIEDIGYAGSSGNLEYEEMINNIELTSSLYADKKQLSDNEVKIDDLDNSTGDFISLNHKFMASKYIWKYNKFDKITNWNLLVNNDKYYFAKYKNHQDDSTDGGFRLPYNEILGFVNPVYKAILPECMIINPYPNPFSINLKLKALFNTRGDNVFQGDKADFKQKNNGLIYCNLYIVRPDGVTYYYDTTQYDTDESGNKYYKGVWVRGFEQGKCLLHYSKEVTDNGIADEWLTNNNIIYEFDYNINKIKKYSKRDIGSGLNISLNRSEIYGQLHFEVCNRNLLFGYNRYDFYKDATDVFVNDLEISIVSGDSTNDADTDDFVYKSFINKKVEADYDDIELKCISANLSGIPFGYANIINNNSELVTSFKRNNCNAELEKLLIRTIHSNHSKKNLLINIELNTSENLSLESIYHKSVLPDKKFYQLSTIIDYANNSQEIQLCELYDDYIDINNIPISNDD